MARSENTASVRTPCGVSGGGKSCSMARGASIHLCAQGGAPFFPHAQRATCVSDGKPWPAFSCRPSSSQRSCEALPCTCPASTKAAFATSTPAVHDLRVQCGTVAHSCTACAQLEPSPSCLAPRAVSCPSPCQVKLEQNSLASSIVAQKLTRRTREPKQPLLSRARAARLPVSALLRTLISNESFALCLTARKVRRVLSRNTPPIVRGGPHVLACAEAAHAAQLKAILAAPSARPPGRAAAGAEENRRRTPRAGARAAQAAPP